ncbi:MAG: ribosome-binding factor A [Gammaproteobacteria bacterium]|jgi:ribosome-binding factor A|nr:ribosome-binding factor A [Gammaproteobacteria bacterium]|tara:strand:- start:8387 stop:8764 length:378 start_codon:yes stop_codon:yes gene_type:complete
MPREFSRGRRIADLIQRELSTLIQREIKDPRLGMITINDAKVSRDLAFADVYFTMLPETNAADAEKVLNGAGGFLRTHLSKVMSTRTTPKLRFHYDATIESGAKISKAIDEARAEDLRRHDGAEN